MSLDDIILDAQLLAVKMIHDNCRDIVHILTTGYAPYRFSTTQNKQLIVKTIDFQLITGQLYNMGPNEILCRCVLEHEKPLVLNEAHAGVAKGYYARKETVHKLL